ncbi:MAG TPA: ATP-binding cassette domain-containing protein [Pseudonocardia sp.]|nr:ATP-binding cassette domain-containing protein [Pseudonocardia sp.]
MSVIQVRGLTKRFRGKEAVNDLTFDVAPGAVTGFLGPNGAGKSTTLRMLLGLTAPTSGEARVLGRLYRELDEPVRRVGVVLEADGVHKGRTGRNHLRILALAAGLPGGRVDEVLQLVGLADAGRRRVRTYSLGMRQRLALAAALLGDPEVLILDEPANGLDPEGIRWMRDFLRARAAEGRTVLVSSHVLAEVEQTVDHVVIIDHGRFVTAGSVRELLGGGDGVRVHTPQADRLLDLLRRDGVAAEPAGPGVLLVPGATPRAVGELAARHGIALDELHAVRRSLEDVFFALTSPAAAQPTDPPTTSPGALAAAGGDRS